MAYRAAGDLSLSDLVSEVTRDLGTLFRQELELAKVETTEQVSRAAKAGAFLGATAVVALLAAMLLSMAAAFGLAAVIPDGLAFLIVGAVFAVAAAVLAQSGKSRLKSIRPVPEQTVTTLRRDIETAKDSLARGAR